MATTTKTQELLDQEQRFWQAMQAKDPAAAGGMTDEGCIVVGAQGVSAIGSESMAKLTEEGQWELQEYTIDTARAQVRFLTDDIALVAYPVNERIVVDGKTMTLDANDASVWVRRAGEWRCAMHTETLAGDPYGRDRGASR